MSAALPTQPILELVSPGLLATLQDRGRPGWRRFGVPASGPMDDHAAAAANRLVGNDPAAPVLELLLQGARLRVLREARMALTGADAGAQVPLWEALTLSAGRMIELPRNCSGVWTYLAVAGGFTGERVLGSASAYPRGGIGRALTVGDVLSRTEPGAGHVASIAEPDRRDYSAPPDLRVWPGPQWCLFSEADRAAFFARPWTLSSRSDRVGYRLVSEPLSAIQTQLLSEPVLPGTIQVPESGLPIVTMRDGPTVGGYAKLAVLDPADISWLAQCRPGQTVRFKRGCE